MKCKNLNNSKTLNNNIMKTEKHKRLVILLFGFLILFSIASVDARLGNFPKGECVDIKTILNVTTVNISTISYPNTSIAVSNQIMEKNGQTFNYTFCDTDETGTYIYDYFDGGGNVFVNDFIITPNKNGLSLYDSIVRIFLIIFFTVLIAGTYHVVGHINFKQWNDRIIEKYKTRNFVKMVLSIILFNIMNNVFIIYYLMGLPIMMILADLTRSYDISGLILIMDVLLSVYVIGIALVGIVFLSYVQEWTAELWDLIKDMDWGIEK